MKKQLQILTKVFIAFVFLFLFSTNAIAGDTITFTWTGGSKAKEIFIQAIENNSFTVDWGDGTEPESYTTQDRYDVFTASPQHVYSNSESIYTVIITSDEGSEMQGLIMNSVNIKSLTGKSESLKDLNCSENELTDINVQGFPALERLWVEKNQLTTVNLSQNRLLEMLKCDNNQITTLDVSRNRMLKSLECTYNYLKNLNLSNNDSLYWLNCAVNELTVLELGNISSLQSVWCYNNQLKSLNVDNSIQLYLLYCENNQLEELNVSKHKELIQLDCSENKLTSLDIKANIHTELSNLHCGGNKLSLENLYSISKEFTNELFYLTMGEQILQKQMTLLNKSFALTDENVFENIETKFVINEGDVKADSSDYSLVKGIITFFKEGTYNVEMTNAAIKSNTEDTVKVVATFVVVDRFSIEDATVNLTGNYIYTGEEIKPVIDIKYLDIILEEEMDYEVLYSNNINAGMATITITGKGIYKGEKTVGFEIEKASQTINFPEFGIVQLRETNLIPEITASSGLKITLSSENDDIAYINFLGFISLNSVGQVDITATQEGNENYHPAEPVTRLLIIVDDVSISGVEEDIKVKIYPNPAEDIIYIESPDLIKVVVIYDINGKAVLHKELEGENNININHLKKGVYLLELDTNKGKLIQKIIKR